MTKLTNRRRRLPAFAALAAAIVAGCGGAPVELPPARAIGRVRLEVAGRSVVVQPDTAVADTVVIPQGTDVPVRAEFLAPAATLDSARSARGLDLEIQSAAPDTVVYVPHDRTSGALRGNATGLVVVDVRVTLRRTGDLVFGPAPLAIRVRPE